jgi:hypothetical protein
MNSPHRFLLLLSLVLAVGSVRADILREYWLNIGGNSISDLTSSPDFPNRPDGTNILTGFESPVNWADNFGERVRGFLTPPVAGTYVFWIASDDNGELWLSTNDDPAQRALIASVPGWTGSEEWNKFPNQKSVPIPLLAGKRYYIEALHKEGGGGDNLAVGWARPGQDTSVPSEVIPGSVLTPWTDDPNYNSSPTLHVQANATLAEAPAVLHLMATVSDDGKPFPTNPGNPQPDDPHKLRWSWTEVSSPPESAGVGWSGNPTSGEAFTYPGSSNPPGTVFTSDPTARFDVPGTYVLQFTASDGGRTNTSTTTVFIKSSSAYRSLGYAYLSPVPRSEYSSPQTRYILIRFQDVASSNILNFNQFISVTGAVSGVHSGQTALASDGRTVRYIMSSDFYPNEVVTVSLKPVLRPGASGSVGDYQFQFVISGRFPDPGQITARGDRPPDNRKARAFDGDLSTQWLDPLVPNAATGPSWIQFLYPGTETHIVTGYILASATNAPADDPSDWSFYGVDSTGNQVLLDHQSGKTFDRRSQSVTNFFSNSIDFRGYRLEITGVRDPATATGVQLAEIQLLTASGTVLREYWTGINGTSVSDLTSDPRFPQSPTGHDLLPTFEAPTDWADNYGTRVRGHLHPPRTGDYTFWIASDDGSELWLSTDDSPANRVKIASVPTWTGSREWGKDPAQKSTPITLVAGQSYYIEALQKEGSGGDNLAVGWAKPGQPTDSPSQVIPGEFLTPWVVAGGVSVHPDGVSAPVVTSSPPVRTGPPESSSATPPRAIGLANQPRLAAAPSPTFPNGVSVPGDFPRIKITINNQPDSSPIFLDNRGGGGHPYNVIFDNSGSPIWYARMPDERRDMKVQKNGVLTMLARDNGNHFSGFDTNYHLIKTYWADNGYGVDEHELQVLPDGHYFLIGLRGETVDMTRFIPNGNPSAGVTEQIIQEFTANDELIFQWRSWDHFDVRDQAQFIDITGGGFDFPHINAIDVDTDGNILISSRSLSEVTKIDRNTGQFIWRLGGNNNQMTFVNDPLQGPRNQHAIRSIGTNRYTLFDNGDLHNPSVSRAVEYLVDPVAMTATVVWQYPKIPTQDYYSFYMGNAQRLPNGNTLINWAVGNLPKLTEVRPDGTKAFEMNWVDGFEAYRVWRCPWKGVATEPYLIVEPNPDNITLTFNQFGDTNVAYYKIYGGTQPASTTLLGESRVTRKALSNLQNGQTYFFRVTAVNSKGVEGNYSNEESIQVNLLRPGQNGIVNGDFSQGQSNWGLALTDTAAGSWSVAAGVAHLSLTTAGASIPSVGLQQSGVTLIQDATYLLEFDAWASKSRIIQPKLQRATSPFTDYSRIGFVSLTTAKTHFRYPFRMNQPTDSSAILNFNVGPSVGDLFFQNVSLVRLSPGDFNRDGRVDWQDLKTLTGDWLKSGSLNDLNADGQIDLRDLDVLGQNWTGK